MHVELAPDRPRLNVTLSDGTVAVLSPLESSDRQWLSEGFDELSAGSRYARFGMGIAELRDSELDYLADVDQRLHVAWGAIVNGEGAGVGRYISVPDSHCPDVAITVVDRYQGHGLGKCLLRSLVAVARVDGIEHLCFEIAPDNVRVQRMLSQFGTTLSIGDGVVSGQLAIDEIPPSPIEDDVVAVLERCR